jgi:hypothetical protein
MIDLPSEDHCYPLLLLLLLPPAQIIHLVAAATFSAYYRTERA